MSARNNRGGITIRDVRLAAVAMEQLSKCISSKTNARNNRSVVFSVLSVPRGYKQDKEGRLSQFSFETPALPESLGAEELN
jgi:hypothetical protein